MVVGWTPTSLAMRRQLQCVASAGFSSRVLRTISASSSGVILRGRPERGRSSSSSSTPPASYRSSHCVTVGLDTPTSRQIADPDRPSAEQRTMLALSTTRCGVVRLFTNRSKRLRSPRRNRILRTGSPMRGIYRMYLLDKRFLLHYTREVRGAGSLRHGVSLGLSGDRRKRRFGGALRHSAERPDAHQAKPSAGIIDRGLLGDVVRPNQDGRSGGSDLGASDVRDLGNPGGGHFKRRLLLHSCGFASWSYRRVGFPAPRTLL